MQIWTVGHSTHPIEEFIGILKAHDIALLADVRSFPASRRHPQFNRASLEITLPQAGIVYEWLGQALGGRRRASKDSPNIALRNESFRGYADHMATEPFRIGIRELLDRAGSRRTAIMCAELLWWRCHRSMISDYLVGVCGVDFEHIRNAKPAVPHRLNRLARVDGRSLIYDRGETPELL